MIDLHKIVRLTDNPISPATQRLLNTLPCPRITVDNDALGQPTIAERRSAMVAVADEFPKTKVAPRALWYAARESARDADDRSAALPVLKRLARDPSVRNYLTLGQLRVS